MTLEKAERVEWSERCVKETNSASSRARRVAPSCVLRRELPHLHLALPFFARLYALSMQGQAIKTLFRPRSANFRDLCKSLAPTDARSSALSHRRAEQAFHGQQHSSNATRQFYE